MPHTQTRTPAHTTLNIQALTTQALRQGQGLSLRPPVETLGWSHYLKRTREGEKEWYIWMHWLTLLEMLHINSCWKVHTSGNIAKPHTPSPTACPFYLTYIPRLWWLLYLRKEALNAHMCSPGRKCVCPDICRLSTWTLVCEPVWLMFRYIREEIKLLWLAMAAHLFRRLNPVLSAPKVNLSLNDNRECDGRDILPQNPHKDNSQKYTE